MRKFMIIEPEARGHHMFYVRRIAREAIAREISVQLVTSEASLANPAYLSMIRELGEGIETLLLPRNKITDFFIKSRSEIFRQLGEYLTFSSFFRSLSADMWPSAIFVPRLEFCDKIIGLLGSPFGKIPWGGLVMSNKFHLDPSLRPPEKNDQVKKIAFLRLLKTRNLKALFTIDELLYDYVKNAFEKESRNFYYVGDPVDMDGDCSRLAARKRFKIPIDAKVIIVYGALHDRKGVLELLYASQIPNFPLDVSIFLAGKQSEDLREKIEASDAAKKLKAANRLFIADRFIDDEEEYAAFKASDLVWIGYNHFYGMSGVMIQGSKMKLPLVVCKSGLISWMTSKYNIGLAVDPSSGEDVSRAISEILSNKRLYEELGSNGYELSMRHTSKKFGNDIIDAILK